MGEKTVDLGKSITLLCSRETFLEAEVGRSPYEFDLG